MSPLDYRSMDTRHQRGYGQASNVYVTRKPTGDSVIVGGSCDDGSAFARVVTAGAARALWFHLTRLLYPELAERVTAIVPTAPLQRIGRPAITSHVTIQPDLDGVYHVTGWGGRDEWRLCLTPDEARRLWQALDVLLHPVGW